MKKLITCIILLNLLMGLYAKPLITEDGCLSFEVPEECGCIDIHHRNPRKLEIAQYSAMHFRDNINSYGRPLYELLKKDSFKLIYEHVKEILVKNNYQETNDFTLDPSYTIYDFSRRRKYIGYLPKSYQPIIREDIIGEEYMYFPINAEIKNKYRATTVNYSITLVLEDRLERISFGISSIENSADDLIQLFPDWFTMHQNNLYYWKDQTCLDEMYDLLFSDDYKKLPRDLQLIRETRDMILQTVRVNDPPVDTSNMQEGVITH